MDETLQDKSQIGDSSEKSETLNPQTNSPNVSAMETSSPLLEKNSSQENQSKTNVVLKKPAIHVTNSSLKSFVYALITIAITIILGLFIAIAIKNTSQQNSSENVQTETSKFIDDKNNAAEQKTSEENNTTKESSGNFQSIIQNSNSQPATESSNQLTNSGFPETANRSTPSLVNERVVNALKGNDIQSLYMEFSPAMQQIFTLESLQTADQEAIVELGNVTNVEIVEPLSILTEPDWNGNWAQSTIKVYREKAIKEYITRYQLENGEWWFAGSIEVSE